MANEHLPSLHLLNRDRAQAPLSANPKFLIPPIFAPSSRPCRVSHTFSLPLKVPAGQYPSCAYRNTVTIMLLFLLYFQVRI